MNVPFELHIALRYLLAKRKQAFISVISFISTLGVTVGVMALVIALALMTGLQQELRDRILGVESAHLRLEARRHRRTTAPKPSSCGRCRRCSGAAPAILGQALIFGARRAARRSRSRASTRRSSSRSPTSAARCAAAASTRWRRGRRSAAGHPARQATWPRKLGVVGRRLVNVITPQDAVADGLIARGRGRCASPAPSSSACSSSTRHTASCRIDVAKRLFGKDRHRLHPAAGRRHLGRAARSPRRIHDSWRRDYLTEDWADMNQSLFSALSLEKMAISLDHRPHRHGRRAEHRRVADPAGDGEAPRHRHSEDDGRERAERHDRSSCCRG